MTAGAVRDAIDFRRLPWIRPLVSEYSSTHARVAALFAGDPADAGAWRQTIGRVTRAARHRAAVADVLSDQLTRRGAPEAARRAVDALRRPDAVAIVTGQQPGLFGGPLYTLLKAVTAIQLARQAELAHGVPAVPVFWVESEDHDWQEIRSARILDRDANVRSVTAPDPAGAGIQPVGILQFDAGITATLAELAALLPATEFSTEVVEALGRRYRAGVTTGRAFAGLLDDLLGRHGLLVLEADDSRLKPLVADLFAAEIATPRVLGLAREGAARMESLGHTAQVDTPEDGVALFHLSAEGRRAIKQRSDGAFQIGDAVRSRSDLLDELRDHPERFGPNVLLRPVVQDRLLPTACYVAGPSELAYQAQLGGVYAAFDVEPPLIVNRGSATLVDAGAIKFFDRSGFPLEALQPQDDRALNRLLERELPHDFDARLSELQQIIASGLESLRPSITAVDATLGGALETTGARLRETLKTLQSKVIQAAKRKDDTLRRQFARTRALVFPEGMPQERALALPYFLNRYGDALTDRLIEVLPTDTTRHYVIAL
jgi:bacillithiol biosynthesis cysteine-adding enzyme BshC